MNRATKVFKTKKQYMRTRSLDCREPSKPVDKSKPRRIISHGPQDLKRVKWAEELEDILVFNRKVDKKLAKNKLTPTQVEVKGILLKPDPIIESDTESTNS